MTIEYGEKEDFSLMDLPVKVVRRQIFSAVDLIVQTTCLKDSAQNYDHHGGRQHE